jgi:hypothetical protein
MKLSNQRDKLAFLNLKGIDKQVLPHISYGLACMFTELSRNGFSLACYYDHGLELREALKDAGLIDYLADSLVIFPLISLLTRGSNIAELPIIPILKEHPLQKIADFVTSYNTLLTKEELLNHLSTNNPIDFNEKLLALCESAKNIEEVIHAKIQMPITIIDYLASTGSYATALNTKLTTPFLRFRLLSISNDISEYIRSNPLHTTYTPYKYYTLTPQRLPHMAYTRIPASNASIQNMYHNSYLATAHSQEHQPPQHSIEHHLNILKRELQELPIPGLCPGGIREVIEIPSSPPTSPQPLANFRPHPLTSNTSSIRSMQGRLTAPIFYTSSSSDFLQPASIAAIPQSSENSYGSIIYQTTPTWGSKLSTQAIFSKEELGINTRL